jgi:chemotaxis protein CheY-P-specific phosphatase CheC
VEYLSQKQIADRFGVPKQKVYRCIKLNHIKEAHSEVVKGNTVLMYDKQAIEQIESILKGGATTSSEAHSEVHHEAVNEALNEAVLKQLDILNEQLKAKDKQIESLQKLLDQEQHLNAMNHEKILLLESKLEEPKEPVEPDEPPTEEPPKGFWSRFFRK